MSTKSHRDQAAPSYRFRPRMQTTSPFTGYCSSNESNGCGESEASHVPAFFRNAHTQLVKAGLSILAITISFLLFQNLTVQIFHRGSVWNNLPRQRPHQQIRNAAQSFLEVFQVFTPVLTVNSEGKLEVTDGSSNTSVELVNNDHATCRQTLVVHSFASSYNQPFIGDFAPPGCDFNRVSWNLTVISAGRQFDRLGIVYLGDIEIFRTSTAEPTRDGIRWTYLKDVTSFLPLFRSEQKVIFDLGNQITKVYTAAFNVTLTAAYFTANDSIIPPDAVVPLSKRLASLNQPSAFIVPPDVASNDIELPRNLKKAVFTIAATGQIEEEFWWSNAPQSDIDTFPRYGRLYGYSPFREIQLLIDGILAGVAWPFPNIFTGGIVPGLWRPIVGIDAFDLKEYEIDITPWLPLLCDGRSHNFTIRVAGLDTRGSDAVVLSDTVGSYWWVTGKIFMWFDTSNQSTTGHGPYITASASDFHISSSIEKFTNGTNETLRYNVEARRSFGLYSIIDLAHGQEVAVWSQSLSFENSGIYGEHGFAQENNQHTSGYDASSNGYAKWYNYPIYAKSVERSIRDNYTIEATIEAGKKERTLGSPVFPTGLETFSTLEDISKSYRQLEASELSTTQIGTATYLANDTESTSFSFGTTQQHFTFKGLQVDHVDRTLSPSSFLGSTELFERFVNAVNATVIDDRGTLVGVPIDRTHHPSRRSDGDGFVL